MKSILLLGLVTGLGFAEELRIIAIGAHPDDCDIKSGGTAALFAAMGHKVKFLSVTNGDAGHQDMGGAVLAKRRYAETQESARRSGISEYEVLNNHDGLLLPTLEVRLQIIRAIRKWNADVVIAPRPNDYHPDHRYTGVLVQDAAYMVVVPNIASDASALKKNPVFLYYSDGFQKPAPFRPDIAISIDSVYEKKMDILDAHVSQFYEWLPWVDGSLNNVPKDAAARRKWLNGARTQKISDAVRASLEKWYGTEKAGTVKQVESFEICEYGKQPNDEEIRRLFPMLNQMPK